MHFTANHHATDKLGLVALLEAFANDQWVSEHNTKEHAVEAIKDRFRRLIEPGPPTPTVEPNATVAKSGAKKRKAAPSDRKPEQPSNVARVEGKLTGKLSAIDAAAKVLESSGALNCKERIVR